MKSIPDPLLLLKTRGPTFTGDLAGLIPGRLAEGELGIGLFLSGLKIELGNR